MDVGTLLIPGAQPLENGQPDEAAFDHPTLPAQAQAAGDAAAGDPRGGAAGAQLPTVDVVVAAAVGEQLPRTAARPTTPAPDRRHRVDQRDQLGDVVAVAASDGDRQRNAAGIDDQVVLGARTPAVDRRRTDMVPPLSARMCEPSTAQRSKSSSPTARS